MPTLKAKLDKQIGSLQTEMTDLQKKIDYLEITAKNSREHINTLLGRGAA